MIEILELRGSAAAKAGSNRAASVLETGGLVLFPEMAFALEADERPLIDPAILSGKSKNVSLDPVTGRVGGVDVDEAAQAALARMLTRFADYAEDLIGELTPRYAGALQRRRTSFRPGSIATRALSPRKDDRRLHTDAFPSNPVQGRRILRVFANINPVGQDRVWELGEDDFQTLTERYRDRLGGAPRSAWLMERLGLTKGRRSGYDEAMLRLHDAAKLDDDYQRSAGKRRIVFPAGCMWVVYTDSVLHAALSGQHALEQTFLMPPEAMETPALAPVRILEQVSGRSLV
ncbi:MAG: Kdo hydroxylase family protein [Caulobacteraceae bacterium]